MSAFVEALKEEIAELEDQLARDPRYQKLRELKRVLPLYQNAPGTPAARTVSQSHTRSFGVSGASADIKNAAEQVLAGVTRPVPTREILEMLTARGVKIGGSVPQNTLSAFLSKSDAFVSHGRSGWTLAVPNSHETETAGDDSSEESPSPATFARRPDQPAEPRAQGRKAVPGGGT
jgi:hypothetical protein